MSWNKAFTAAPIVLSVLALAACGGTASGDGDEVASLGGSASTTETDATTTTTSDDPQEVLLDYTECMRDEGVDLPDPDFSGEGGRGDFRIQIGPGVNGDDPDFRAAQEKCGPILESLRQNFSEEDRQAFQDAALDFAKCMREHGVDVPDPDFSEAAPGKRGPGGPFRGSNIDPSDPEFQAAREACEDEFGDLPRRFVGPGGGSDGK